MPTRLTTSFGWTKTPCAMFAAGWVLFTSVTAWSARIVMPVAAPAARNWGKMICGKRELPKRSDCPFADYEQASGFVTQRMRRQ